MAVYDGFDGTVTYNTSVTANISSFEINVAHDVQDDSYLGDKWKGNRGGQASWAGSCEGAYEHLTGQAAMATTVAIASPLQTGLTLVLLSAGKTFTGTAIVTGFKVSNPVSAKVHVSFDFVGDGALVIT
jgi:hypothetical protein